MTTPAEQIRKTIQILESQDLDEISKIGTAIAGILAMAGAFGVNIPSSYAQTPPQHGVQSQTVKGLDAAIFRTIGERLTPGSQAATRLERLKREFSSLDDIGQNFTFSELGKIRNGNIDIRRVTDTAGVEGYVANLASAVARAMGDYLDRQDAAEEERQRKAARDNLKR